MSLEFFTPSDSDDQLEQDPFDSVRFECFAPSVVAATDRTSQQPEDTSAGDPVRDALGVLAGARITRDGTNVRDQLNGRTEIRFSDQPVEGIRFEPNISCNATCTDNTISMTNISGIAVDLGPGMPWVNVQQIVINGDRATVTIWPGVPVQFDLQPGSFGQIRTVLQNAGILP